MVNKACSQQIKSCCIDIDNDENRCELCKKAYIFDNIHDFTEWILRQKNSILLAHNFKAYDGILIMKNFMENVLPKDAKNSLSILNNGNKIIAMKFRN
jgi:hypothetical protein